MNYLTADYLAGVFLYGAGHFIVAFGLACLFLAAFKRLYQISTPYDEAALIADGNVAAAVALGGAIIGFALPLASALTQTADPLEFTVWAVLAGVVQILASLIVRRFVVRDLAARIERGNVATGVYLGATSIGVGLLNAASMTY
jgi:putative membrane protein